MIKVQQENFNVAAELAALTAGNHGIGGVVSFVGLVREMVKVDDRDAVLQAMTLEHYPGMTERKLAEIEREYRRSEPLPRFSPGDTVKVLYRVREGDKERIQVFQGVIDCRRSFRI